MNDTKNLRLLTRLVGPIQLSKLEVLHVYSVDDNNIKDKIPTPLIQLSLQFIKWVSVYRPLSVSIDTDVLDTTIGGMVVDTEKCQRSI